MQAGHWLVVQLRVGIHHPAVNLGQADDVVAVVVNGIPSFSKAPTCPLLIHSPRDLNFCSKSSNCPWVLMLGLGPPLLAGNLGLICCMPALARPRDGNIVLAPPVTA